MDILNAIWHDQFGDFNQSDISYIFDPELAAIYLAATPQNYEQLLALSSYPAQDLYELQKAQFCAIASLQENLLDARQLAFYLRELAPIGAPQIEAELRAVAAASEAASQAQNPFSAQAAEDAAALAARAQELLDPALAAALASRCEQLRAGAYAMGFCGCFNAGKSSLINALLDTQLLAASNAPETAAISVLRYAERPVAHIEYYSREEFEQIARQAALSPEAAALFARGFPDGLKPLDIELCELSSHSGSASAQSHLIRQIHINLPAPLLRSGAHLIDTPGLDDLIISREQTSLRHLRECDEIFYLMSAAQALSSKDCEFLRKFAAENPQTKLSLVLSKCDLIEPSELPALLAYVKEKFAQLDCANAHPVGIFALSANTGAGLGLFKNYLLAQIAGKDARQAELLRQAAATAVREQLGICEQIFEQEQTTRMQDEQAAAAAAQRQIAQNKALETAAQELEQLQEALKNHQFEEKNARFLLAKRLAERIEGEFAYDKNFTEKSAQNIAQQAFADFCSELSASSIRYLQNTFAKAGAICAKFCVQMPSQQEFEQLFTRQIPPADIGKFLRFSQSEQSAILPRLEAVFCNCDLSLFAQPAAQAELLRAINSAAAHMRANILPPAILSGELSGVGEKTRALKELLAECEGATGAKNGNF